MSTAKFKPLQSKLPKAGIEAVALLVQGAISATILNEAFKLDADMIIVGSHGRGAMYQLLVGSVSEEVIHKSRCPVLESRCPVLVVPTHGRT